MDSRKLEKLFSEYIIELVGPTESRDKIRIEKFEFLKQLIIKAIDMENLNVKAHVFCFGSFPQKAYLHDTDLDITILFEDISNTTLITNYSFEFANKIILLIQTTLENYNTEKQYEIFSDINLIFADIKLLKCKYDNLSIDISINNYGGLSKLIFMNYIESTIEAKIKDRLLFKRTLILIKAWSYYEGCILGSNIGLMASYALEVLVIYLFNNFSDLFNSEVEAFFMFFQVMKAIDWDNEILHIFGTMNIDIFTERLKIINSVETNYLEPLWYLDNDNSTTNSSALTIDDTGDFLKDFEKVSLIDKSQSGKKNFQLKFINIIDPMFSGNNLGKSINFHNFSRIKKVIEFSCKEIEEIIQIRSKNDPYTYLSSLMKIFQKTLCNTNSELLLSSLSVPKIIINPYINYSSRDNGASKNGVIFKNGMAKNEYYDSSASQYKTMMFPTLNEPLILKFNKQFLRKKNNNSISGLSNNYVAFEENKYMMRMPNSHVGEKYYLNGGNSTVSKEILEILIKKIEDDEITSTYDFINFYISAELDEFFKKYI